MKNGSFSHDVKEELCLIGDSSLARNKAILAAYLRCNSYLSIQNNKTFLNFQTENAKVARYIYQLIKDIYAPKIHFIYVKNKKLNKTTAYKTIIDNKIDDILDDLDLSFVETKISRKIVFDDETIAGYLCGTFLACGSVNSPYNSKYHLELALQDEDYAKRIVKLFLRHKTINVEPKIVQRRNQWVVYIKKSDKIGDFLIMIGAVRSCIDFENVRVNRDFVNNANRLTNLDTANMTKTVEVAVKQKEWINTIDKYLGVDNIPNEKVKALCKLRLKYESASMSELSELMSKQLNIKVSKSNIAHLFRKINEMAEKFKYDCNR